MNDLPETTDDAPVSAEFREGWIAGAEAMKMHAVTSCDLVLNLLATGAIHQKTMDLISALRREIENSPIPGIVEPGRE